jgi:hypothetical protein
MMKQVLERNVFKNQSIFLKDKKDVNDLMYPVMITVGDRQQVAHSWTHRALKPYANQGSYQNGMAHMFWVSVVANFLILIVLYFDMRI